MKDVIVRDLMVPLSEYATVPEGSTLFEAVMALEKAQEEFDYKHTQYLHRAILILDKNQRVIGKLSQIDVLRALEQKNEKLEQIDDIRQFGFSDHFVASLKEEHQLKGVPLKDFCSLAVGLKVENFMQAASEGEYIDENSSLDAAIYRIVRGGHLGLLVTREDKIVGILRMSDVFAAVFHAMKECEF